MNTKLTQITIISTLALASTASANNCPKTINATKQWTYDSPMKNTAAGSFGIGVGAGVGATGDCHAISVDASTAIRARAFSIGGNALEAKVIATTNRERKQSLTLTWKALGYDIVPPRTIVDSDQALSDVKYMAYTLPTGAATDGSWSGRKSLFGTTVNYGISYDLVADLVAIANYNIKPTGVFGSFWGHAEVRAHVQANGAVTFPAGSNFQGSASADVNLTLFSGTALARGKFALADLPLENAPPNLMMASIVPRPDTNNAWRTTAVAEYKIDDALRGSVVIRVKAKHTTPPVLDYDESFTLLSLDPLPASARAAHGWSFDRTYFRPF